MPEICNMSGFPSIWKIKIGIHITIFRPLAIIGIEILWRHSGVNKWGPYFKGLVK